MKKRELANTFISVPTTKGDKVKCWVFDELSVNGNEYLVLMPLEKEDRVSLRYMRYGERDGLWGYLPVHDIHEKNRVHAVFCERISNNET